MSLSPDPHPDIYESSGLLAEYLLFHYGTEPEVLPYDFGPRDALFFPVRCVRECLDPARLPSPARALDVGCAVGRSSFELARHCHEVVGIDFSRQFVAAASVLQRDGQLAYSRLEEGARRSPAMAIVPKEIERGRVRFEQGDAMALRGDLGTFDVVLAANLLCRLQEPARFLRQLPGLLRPGGQLILTTPCTWIESFTPREHWLCTETQSTLDGVRQILDPKFTLDRVLDLPFLIREHARKFQWTVAQASLWRNRELPPCPAAPRVVLGAG